MYVFQNVGVLSFCIFATIRLCNILDKRQILKKPDVPENLKRIARMGTLALKIRYSGWKRGFVAVTIHIYTFLLVGTNSCLTVDLLYMAFFWCQLSTHNDYISIPHICYSVHVRECAPFFGYM